ncbi:MAG: DnaB-like helicase C-terminal domain-containing protein [Planctomycetota bacterium]
MKLPPKQRTEPNYESAARRAMMKIEPKADEQDGSTRLLMYCRQCKRFGIPTDRAIVLIRDALESYPTPRQWSDKDISRRYDEAKVEVGEACDDDDIPPWEKTESSSKPQHEKPKDDSVMFASGAEALDDCWSEIVADKFEVLYDCGLLGFEMGPGKLTVLGAPPGAGKTSLASQLVFAALSNHPDLNVVIANAEMTPNVLLKRELSRRSGVSYQTLRFGPYSDEDRSRLFEAKTELEPLLSRTSMMLPPYRIDKLVESLSDEPGLLVIDYLQKFRVGDSTYEGIEEVVSLLRWAAMAGWAILAISSTSRGEGKEKHSSENLGLASFRGSGEIEFQADSAYVIKDQSGGAEGDRNVRLECVKNRHGSRESFDLVFRVERLEFEGDQVVKKHDFGVYGGHVQGELTDEDESLESF